MANLRDYKNKDFSLTLNKRMNGIELRFAHKMSEEQISLIKDAGFKWSKRQQMWYAYQNDKSIACATSLVDYYENTISAQEFNQKVTEKIESIYAQDSNAEIASLAPLKIISVEEVENNIEEITVNELAELVRQRAELDKKINAIREVLDNKGNKIDVSSEQAREFVLEMNEAVTEKEDEIENKQSEKEIELSIEDLEIVKRFIPEMEYSTLLDNATHGEETEYFKKKIKHIADMGHIIYENKEGKSYNEETKLHDKGFVHYFIGNSDWYVCEVDDDNIGFGFVVLNGDTQNAEYGYIDLNEVTTLTLNGFVQTELDIYIDDRVSMEQAIVEKYPELKNELFEGYENPVEAENGQTMAYADAREWNEEQRMQYSQEEDERGAEAAARDFDTVRKLEGIVSEIKTSGFTLESKYENEKHAVTLRNKSGEVIFSARENDNIVIPIERTIAIWANDEASEKAKTLADEFFSLVCEDGIRGGDYVNNVFTNAEEISEINDYIHSEEFVSKFGDWEKANRLEKLKNSEALIKDDKIFSSGEDITKTVERLIENKDRRSIQSIEKELGKTVAGTYINQDTGLYIAVSNRNVTEISNHHYLQKEHIQAIQYIPEIIDRAIFIGNVGNEDKLKHPNIQEYKYFATGININGTDFTCKTVVGVDKNGNCYYDQSLSSIEKGKLVDIIQQKNKPGNLSPLITQRESEPKPGNLSHLIATWESEPLEKKSPTTYYDKRLINICQVPQMPYLEMKDGRWQPKKEAVQAIKEGKLFIEKNGQNYTMHDETVKKNIELSGLQSVLKAALKQTAVPLEKIEFTRDNYNKLFPYSKIETPIENVKMGEHQFEKLEKKERQNILLPVHDTLKNPDLIINEQKENVFGENEDNHIYAKSFLIDDKVHGVQSVVISIDGESVSISTHERNINNIVNKIKKPDQLLYAAAKVRLLVERATGEQLVTVNPIRENEYVVSPKQNIQQNSESVNEEKTPVIYFNDLSPEQKEEVINGYRSADDQDMLTEWENVLRKNLTQIKKDNPFIPSLDIEKEISVAVNPPSDEWISEYLQKNKVNFNTDFWQDIFAEMEAKPELKTYHTLKESDVKNLEIVSDEEFSDIVDSIILNDYKNIPNAIRLPNLNAELSEKLGLEKNSAFILKKSSAHIRPDRKGSYEQALDTEEYREIPQVMRDATFALVDNRVKNFQILFDDKNDIKKINKIVFNKDELGNYLVTVGKVGRQNGISEKENIVVGVGVAPTISDLRFPKEQPATRLRPSPTTDELNIAQKSEKSRVSVEKQREPISKKKLSEIRSQCREILKKPDSEITDDDKAVLAKYEGAGGLNEDNRSVNGVLNEFYTPQNLIEKVWELVDAYAPDAKTVLEPSAGVGKFANNRPNNKFTMHELDETSARINKILHPEADVIQGAYQRQFFDEGGRVRKSDFVQPKYDVVIGNPPYGKYSDKYKGVGEGKEFDRYEEYFISKGLDALKDEKSVMAFVVPSGFLNSENDKIKNLIASQGELIDAYRLPAGTFPTTEVGTDIIVMKSWDERKRALNERARGNEVYQKLEITSWTKREAYKISGGQWFKDHPEKILGKTVGFTDRFGKPAIKVVPHDGLSVQDELDKIDGFLPQGIENPGENHSRKMPEPRPEILSSDFKGFRNIADRISAIDESAQNRIGAVKIKTDAQSAEEYFSFMKSHIDFAGSLSTSVFNELENRNRHTATAALSIMGFFGKENQEYFAQRSEKNRENPDSYDFPPEIVAKEINLSREQWTPEKQKIENIGQHESSPQTLAANFVLEKLKATGIEVITDKEEFERILEREKFLQKMAGTLAPEEQKRYFTFNGADTAKFKSQVDEWSSDKSNIAKLITVGKIPPVMKVLGFPDNPIEIQHSTLSKIMRPIPQGYPDEAQGHALSADDIYAIPSQLADPIMVFKSRTRDDSYVFFTERKDSQNHSILIPMAVNKRKGRIVINEITSMYGKDNEIDFVRKNIDEGNLIYADKKRSTEWERSSHVQFVTQRLSNSNAYDVNILTKERLVNFISADSQKRTPVQKMALASDRENVYGFAYEGKIYLNPDFLNSNVAVHEYTHLWDEYTRRTNPELWQKGMDIFKDTKFFNEVKNDPNYADIANDDNLVLSEVHARICGEMAEKILERIAKEDGEITKDKAVDWNEETAEYVKKELFPGRTIYHARYHTDGIKESEIDGDAVERFLSTSMKDLVNGLSVKHRDFETKFRNGDFTEIFERLSDINFKADIYKTMSREEQAKQYNEIWDGLFQDGEPSEIESKRKEWKARVMEHDKNFTRPETLASYKKQARKAPAEKIEELLSKLKSNNYSFYPETQEEADAANERTFKSAILNRIAKKDPAYYNHSFDWSDVYVPSDTIIASCAETKIKMQVLEEELKERGISKETGYMENIKKETEEKPQKSVKKMKDEQAKNQAVNFVLEKLKAAGIEVVTDKDKFDRILEREKFLQKMAGTLAPEEQKRYFTFNGADTARFKSQVDEWKKSKDENNRFNPGKLIKVGEIPPLFNALGIADNPIEVQYATLSKMVRPLPQGYPDEAQGHALSADDIYDIPSQLADPIMVFKSRTRDDSYVFFTERKDSQNHSILIPIAVNKRKGRIVINEITSMYGKDNEIDFVRKNIDEGNLIYADKKRSLEWERECKVQFLTQGLPSQDSIDNILTKERLVNFISAGSQKRTPVQKMALSSDCENVYGFAYEGKIYLNSDFLNSNVAVHEYTHLWDEYMRRTNPELWQKGMDIFKDTKFFNEVKNDPNYADIANDDNLVLSEVHARICGEMAEKILERIAKEDGEITKDKAVDWNEETAAYILDFLKKANPENEFIQEMEASEIRKDMIEFFATPLKDLVSGKNISLQQEKGKEQPSQRTKTQNVELQSRAIDIVNAVEKRKETEQKNAAEKSKWSITKSKGEVMSAEEFAHLYGRDFDEREFPIWRATDWQGIIDRTKLSYEEENLLYTSKNYVEIETGEFTHKVLFESGDISSKIESYKNKITFLKQNEDERKRELYKKNIAILEKIAPQKIPMERLHFCVNSTLAEEFTIEHINSEGEIEKLNLQESFILWAKGQTWEQATSRGAYWRNGIDFTTANISEEDFPQNVTWYDIVEYIDRKSVKAERVSTWRKSDAEIKEEKAQKRKEAEEKRMARSETADRLFDKYLHEGLSSELSAKVEAEYNRRFNSYIIPDYSKLPIFIDGMSREKDGKKFKLYDQQVKGVSFLCNKGNGLLAYDVGVGKTAAGIVATVNQIQTGRSKRPLIVVPNTVYPKWYENIQALFPNIKVNDLYNLNKESSSKYRNAEAPHKLDIPENSISLVTYEALKNITFTDTSCENELFEDYSKLLSEDFEGSARENAQNADKIKSVIGAASQIKNSDYVFFEDCGFDNILVDEAHNFKNLWTVPRPKSKGESNEFSGIPTSKPSVRALKLFAMTQLTQRHNDDRNVFLLTATPFVNSPLEVYSMISYVGRKRLVDSGIYSLRDFCTEFAHTKLELGVNAKGEIDQKQVMKDWKELPALQKILTEFIDKVDGEELKEIMRPKKFTHVQEIEMSDLQKKMMQTDTEKMSEVKEGNSAAVIVSMNAMRVALVAPALADPARYPELNLPSMKELVETSPKLKFVCDSVIEMYKNNPEKGQFIYMPLGQTAHGIVKDYLIAHGLPNESVEIINGSINNTTDKKAKITEKFNDPNSKCKILIGGKNTSEGIDLNGNSFVMYNCSLGWNPSETIQAEGRIWRQGNQQGHVHCVYPVMNDSIDSLLYQKHDEKRSRINEIWTYKASDTLNVEDINPEELKFELIKDPQKRAKLILENGIDTPEYKFIGTKHIQNDLNKVNSRIKSFEEVEEKRKKIVENLRGAEINIGSRLKNIEDYKNRNLEVPEWCKLELKEERKFKESYEHQLETINRKYVSWGIKEEKAIEDFIPKMNAKKHELERELNEKKNELPKILEKEMLKLKEKKILLPAITEQCKILTENIEKNLRPMSEVEPEIRTLRFEQMLSQKWEKGEISKDEKDLYLSVGYKRYYEWLDGEIDTLEETKIIESSLPVENTSVETMEVPAVDPSVEVIKKAVDKEIEQNQQKETYNDCGLFSDQEMAKLEKINKVTFQEKKNHQLITYSQDGGVDEKLEYSTLSEAQKAGKEFLKNWELDKADNGFVVFNKETKQIESTFGYFPVEEAFSKEVLLINGYQVLTAKEPFSNQEIKVSEIANAVKEQLSEQNDSQKHVENHISFTVFSNPKISKGTVSW